MAYVPVCLLTCNDDSTDDGGLQKSMSARRSRVSTEIVWTDWDTTLALAGPDGLAQTAKLVRPLSALHNIFSYQISKLLSLPSILAYTPYGKSKQEDCLTFF